MNGPQTRGKHLQRRLPPWTRRVYVQAGIPCGVKTALQQVADRQRITVSAAAAAILCRAFGVNPETGTRRVLIPSWKQLRAREQARAPRRRYFSSHLRRARMR